MSTFDETVLELSAMPVEPAARLLSPATAREKARMQEIFTPLRQDNLRHQVYDRIRAAILAGHLGAGARLFEADIAEMMGVSRAPVREALAILEQEGLVVGRPNRGTYVAEIFSERDVYEITTLRSALETMAVTIAAAKVTPRVLDELADLAEQMQAAVDRRDLALLADVDFQFHSRIVKTADHHRLYQVWSTLAAQYWAVYLTTLRTMGQDDGDYPKDARAGHMSIVDALAAGQTDRAVMYLQYNICHGSSRIDLRSSDRAADDPEDAIADDVRDHSG